MHTCIGPCTVAVSFTCTMHIHYTVHCTLYSDKFPLIVLQCLRIHVIFNRSGFLFNYAIDLKLNKSLKFGFPIFYIQKPKNLFKIIVFIILWLKFIQMFYYYGSAKHFWTEQNIFLNQYFFFYNITFQFLIL